MAGDVLTLESDRLDGEALIQPVMRAGRRIAPPVPLTESRARARRELSRLPDALTRLERGPEYSVRVSQAIQQLAREVDSRQFQVSDQQRLTSTLTSEQPSVG
jgi:nicotinate phosphoribosyltransferase